MQHVFGGGWTQIKLDVLRAYLRAYVTALKNQKKHFKLLYIDAFAGTGECTPKKDLGITLDGSAKIALETPGFDEYLFIENHPERLRALSALCAKYRDKTVYLEPGDANEVLREKLPSLSRFGWRAVAFLDPYGLQLNWETLTLIAQTGAIDVWYLFPLSGAYRQAAKRLSDVDEAKRRALDRCLGTNEWQTSLYSLDPQMDFFNDPELRREPGPDDIEHFVTQRLQTIFPAVLKPLRLPKTGAPLCSLFFAVSNKAAINVASRIASHILSKA